tara:strand:- start:1444 stop:1830 length:387 start_codon:yes stop_codon:yes gene_type:complete
MIINTPISLGELFDKISILKIKKKNIKNKTKQRFINNELTLLKKILDNTIHNKKKINQYLKKLIKVNTKLWKIEDDIRNHEKTKKFDKTFIDLARSVYKTNDFRAKIKNDINQKFGSKILEVKSYKKY